MTVSRTARIVGGPIKDSRLMEQATFGAGRFWGVKSFFRDMGDWIGDYTCGAVANSTVHEVCADTTGHEP
jgi:peptide methionine sulfoxide reductase MsrA